MPVIVLASTSSYRRALLTRIVPAFSVAAPGVDESSQADETPPALAQRLALAKARAVAAQHPGAIVIGSDQVADLDGLALGKPGDHARAQAQLRACSGHVVRFHTALAVIGADGIERTALDQTDVRFRQLDDTDIDRYLQREKPYDCAGSFKCEGLGIALFEAIHTTDPTALVGLPLIATARLLREAGFDPLG